jgi:ParB-like chromosome segregation protein Spo0J
MIQNTLRLLPLSEVVVEREHRQRQILTQDSVVDLALSIARHGLLQNIGVKAEDFSIIFGERRYTACSLIHATLRGEYDHPELLAAAQANPLYDDWQKIPVRLCKNTDKLSSGALEFIENTSRLDLSWQDQAKAAWELHRLAVFQSREQAELWSERKTSEMLGISPSALNRLITPFRVLESASEKTKPAIRQAIEQSPTALSANNSISAIKERHGEAIAVRRTPLIQAKAQPTAIVPVAPPVVEEPERTLGEKLLRNVSFLDWALTYTGPQFNFMHCDFPYGISYNSSGGQNTSAATKQAGEYDDSPEIYWALLECLLANRERILTSSAHIMFWFSQNLRRETEDRIMEVWPDAVISKFLLIWHCSDNSGLMPTPAEGRRTYETALQITLGGRPLVGGKAMSFSSPRNENKIHRSQKPLAVLGHFFQQYVDDSTQMLDPTCGSATSVITATKLKANYALGLEIDPDMHKQAVGLVNKELV